MQQVAAVENTRDGRHPREVRRVSGEDSNYSEDPIFWAMNPTEPDRLFR
jgi:hypothetical protein